MPASRTFPVTIPAGWLHTSHFVVGCLLFSGLLVAQDAPNNAPALSPVRTTGGALLRSQFTQRAEFNSALLARGADMRPMGVAVTTPESAPAPDGPRRITLEQAKQQAAGADNPMIKLGQLQVEAAKQNRLGAESDNIWWTFSAK